MNPTPLHSLLAALLSAAWCAAQTSQPQTLEATAPVRADLAPEPATIAWWGRFVFFGSECLGSFQVSNGLRVTLQ